MCNHIIMQENFKLSESDKADCFAKLVLIIVWLTAYLNLTLELVIMDKNMSINVQTYYRLCCQASCCCLLQVSSLSYFALKTVPTSQSCYMYSSVSQHPDMRYLSWSHDQVLLLCHKSNLSEIVYEAIHKAISKEPHLLSCSITLTWCAILT